ncbi:hypothetical protein MNV49_003286 [Pseudohyphozyma bogoriensis]|nr:hypothetical protein MNV49_003286 [Pseudohyphozyma bogoriensis]
MSYAGGFMSGSQGGGSQGSPGSKVINARQTHSDSEFFIDDTETKDVTFVACLRSVNKGTTNISCVVEDGTGSIDVRLWVNGAEEGVGEDLEENKYARVVGAIKTFSGKRHIVANTIRPIEDKNEIFFHGLEAISVHLHTTRGPPGGATAAPQAAYNAGANPYAQNDTSADSSTFSDLKGLERKIMEHISGLNAAGELPNEGMNVQSLQRELGSAAGSLDRVREEIQNLVEAGHLYMSVDDDHFLPTA